LFCGELARQRRFLSLAFLLREGPQPRQTQRLTLCSVLNRVGNIYTKLAQYGRAIEYYQNPFSLPNLSATNAANLRN
jgi:hypothetical protein